MPARPAFAFAARVAPGATMSDRPRDPYDLRGFSRLGHDAVVGLTDLVEAMHSGILRPWQRAGRPRAGRTRGLTGWIYGTIRSVTGRVGRGLESALTALGPALSERATSARREAVVAALNGVLGDYLEASGNPLATPLTLRRDGRDLPRTAGELAAAVPGASGRLVLLVHGLCRSDAHWQRREHDHGEALARDLGATAIYVRFNSGRHVSENARELAERLEELVAAWPVPVEQIAIVAHSLGGLVARGAARQGELADADWRRRLRHLVFLGTPHHGAPLERGGQWLHRILGAAPYARPLARLGNLRSAGITDLRHGSVLEEDWRGRDRFAPEGDRRHPLPLPEGVICCAVAATTRPDGGALRARLVGDGLVPVASALGRHTDPALNLEFPPERQWIAVGMNHLDLLSHPEVYARIRNWLLE